MDQFQVPVHLSATGPTKAVARTDLLTQIPWKNLYESATPSSQLRLESPPIASSSSGDSTAPDLQTAAQMSEHPYPHSHRRSPRPASQVPPSADAGRPSATSPELHSYPPYTNYYPLYPPPTNIDPSLATSPPNFGYPQFYHQGSHSSDPGLVSTGPGHSGYHQPLVHSQSHYNQPTYSTDSSGSYSSTAARPPSHPFSPPPTTSTLNSGGQTQSAPAIFSGAAHFSTVQHYPPHAVQGTQFPYPQPSYPVSSRHQVFSPPPPAQYHPTPAENDHGQHVGWWYAVPAGISIAPQYETSSRMPYQSHPQYPAPFNPHDQRYSPAGPLPVASGGRSSQGTPRRGTINVTNASSASTSTSAPPVLQRSDSAPTSPTQPSPASGNNAMPRRGSQRSTSANKASGAPGPPRSTVASATEKGPTRRSYHPNPPASRSEWVMWVGNVPPDATEDELWQFFCSPTLTEKEHPSTLKPPRTTTPTLAPPPSNLSSSSRSSPSSGSSPSTATPSPTSTPQSTSTTGIISIFLISRSCCAFVNYENEPRLRNAIARFNGKVLRPSDPKCPKLVCRERKKEDDLKAGVGGQRGTGMHSKWIREQKVKVASPAPMLPSEEPERPPPKPLQEQSGAESTTEDEGTSKSHRTKNRRTSMSSSSGSYSSTTSSLLTRFFPKRYFILKSLTQYDVDLSVKEGLWATQKHNEGILDQAYRTSQDVYLIFSVNKSGEFYGYARMVAPIRGGEHSVSWASRTPSSSKSSLIPATSGSTKGTDGLQEGSGASVPHNAPASAPLPSSSHSEPSEAAHSMPELGAGSTTTPGSKRSFLSPRDNHTIAESPLSLDEDGEDVSQLPTIKEESPGSTPPSDYDPQRHTYPPNLIPRAQDVNPHLVRQSFSAPPEFAATLRMLGDHTLAGPRSEADLNTVEFTVPPLELDPNAPILARRSPPESPDKEKEEGGSKVADKQEEGDDGPIKLRKFPVEGVDQAAEGVGKKTEGTKREESWGEPFKIEWLCLQKLPFQRTRQIRNPWNHDREVKVSRDGTELEPVVGQRLLDEFAKLAEELKQGQSAEGTTTINSSGGNEGAVGGDEA